MCKIQQYYFAKFMHKSVDASNAWWVPTIRGC